MLGNQYTVYVIDPDAAVHDALSTLLGSVDVNVSCFLTAEDFLRVKSPFQDQHGCLLLEVDLPGMGGLALIRQLREQDDSFPVVVLASTADSEVADQAIRAGAVDVLYKPLTTHPLLERLNTVVYGGEPNARQSN